MTLSAFYKDGTVTLTNGSTTVLGSGTAWATMIRAGDQLIVDASGRSFEILTIVSDDELELTVSFPDVTAVGAAYRVQRMFARDYASQTSLALQSVMGNGALTAYANANPDADEIVFGTGPGEASTTTLTDIARSLLDDTSIAAMRLTLGVPSATEFDNLKGIVGASDPDVRVLDATTSITTNTTWNDRQILVPAQGKITVDSGVTLTINGEILAKHLEIFDGNGSVEGTFGGKAVSLKWWGVTDSTSASNDTKFIAAVIAAANAGVELDFDDLIFTSSTGLRDTVGDGTGPFSNPTGNYIWRKGTVRNQNGPTGAPNIEISQPPEEIIATVTADITAGDYTMTLDTVAGLAIEQRILIVSDEDVYSVGNTIECKASQFVTIKRIDGLVVTIMETFKFDFLSADTPKIVNASRTIEIDFEDMEFTGNVAGDRINLGISFANIERFNCHVQDVETTGVYFDLCSFSQPIGVTFENIEFGYPVAFYGCDSPKFSFISGKLSRHVNTSGKSSPHSVDVGGVNWHVLSHDLIGGLAGGIDCTNSVFDTHAGCHSGSVQAVHGNINPDTSDYPGEGEAGQLSDGVTMEGGGQWTFGSIDVRGSHEGLSVLSYTMPKGALPNSFHVGHLVHYGPKTGAFSLHIKNFDVRNYLMTSVSIGTMNSSSGGGVSLFTNTAAENGGDIRLTIGNGHIKAWNNNAFESDCGDFGRCNATLTDCILDCQSTNSNHMALVAYGTDYRTANPGEYGTKVNMQAGELRRLGDGGGGLIAVRAYSSSFILGADVDIVATAGTITNESISDGLISRVDVS